MERKNNSRYPSDEPRSIIILETIEPEPAQIIKNLKTLVNVSSPAERKIVQKILDQYLETTKNQP